jgi:hypothetical protein
MIAEIKIAAILDHDQALWLYRQAGHDYPTIPKGCNTFTHHFTTAEGHPAVIINQTGFTRELTDNEQQVNGCTVYMVEDGTEEDLAREAMDRFLDEILGKG